jgi:hypothetical protein
LTDNDNGVIYVSFRSREEQEWRETIKEQGEQEQEVMLLGVIERKTAVVGWVEEGKGGEVEAAVVAILNKRIAVMNVETIRTVMSRAILE